MATIINIALLNPPGSIPVFSVHSIYGDDITKDFEILVGGSNVKLSEIKSTTKLAIADSSGISIITAAFSKSQIGYIKFKHELTTLITVSCGEYDDSVNPPTIANVTTNNAGPGEIRVGGFTGSNGHSYASRMLANPSGTTNSDSTDKPGPKETPDAASNLIMESIGHAASDCVVIDANIPSADVTIPETVAWLYPSISTVSMNDCKFVVPLGLASILDA